MQGRGITNYSTSKPTHGFSTATTEFDDALLQRGIINFEQAMMAKGATYEEATKLKQTKEGEGKKSSDIVYNISNKDTPIHEEDDFIKQYRKKRMKELSSERYGSVLPIQRNEWNHQVNDASQDGTWVVINLTAQKSSPNLHPMHKDICLLLENEIIPQLASKFPAVKFVSIPSTSAIENWPENNLPTLFCYRYGKLQHQLVGLGEFGIRGKSDRMHCDKVEYRLSQLGIIDSDITEEEDDDDDVVVVVQQGRSGQHHSSKYGRSHFGGVMAQLQTSRDSDDSDDGYDDVD